MKNVILGSLIGTLLAVAIVVVFGQTVRHGFINFDDGQYVYENQHVQQGLTGKTVAWSFTAFYASNWHPLTWLSHAADCQLFRLNAAGHHAVNVLLHIAVAILLFLTLWRMTANLWPAAFVAAVFAVHPLRVESVAWVAERKDLLCGLFFMLTLAAYVRYVRHPFSLPRYLLVAVLFAMSLMAKPMAVTLPFVLLLLDYWPLGRNRPGDCETGRRGDKTTRHDAHFGACLPVSQSPSLQVFPRLLLEKLPLLLLSAASCVVTSLAQHHALATLHAIPYQTRIANAAISCVAYIGQMFWPAGLAVFYPYPEGNPPLAKTIAAIAALAGVSAIAFLMRRRFPCLLVGWFWYLGMLVPVIGLVQVGDQAMADRYTYLPQIGLAIAIAWTVASLVADGFVHRWACGAVAAAVLASLMVCAWLQTSHWRNSETLWRHTLEQNDRNVFAHNNLGMDLARRRQFDAAVEQYQAALAIRPDPLVYNNFGVALAMQKRLDEAAAMFRAALKLNLHYDTAHNSLANVLFLQNQLDAAADEYREAIRWNPDCAGARERIGEILKRQGKTADAATH
jgi:hypothetical protein